MLISFFIILPQGPLKLAHQVKDYESLPEEDNEDGIEGSIMSGTSASLLGSGSSSSSYVKETTFISNLRRAKSLFFPYMLPLLLVYIAEYSINQGVSPTLLFPLPQSPFNDFRSFYPFYNFLYQVGVFIARSSTPFVRIHSLYVPSLLQVANLGILISHAMYNWIPSIYIVFLIIFWEGLLGGAVYVNTFAEIMEKVPDRDREFSLGATSVSDSGGICVAGFIGMALEVWLCNWQVDRGRKWCKQL
jgi:battenin